jgi:anti-sigma regulatory factor (Ser/Thr protein kinase)
MDNAIHKRYNAEDRSYFASLKKSIHSLAVSEGFGETQMGKIDIVVAEIASNLVKHATSGEILVKVLSEGSNKALEIIGIDGGRGIPDTKKVIEDGVSTTNTLGHGLGSIRRLSDVFEIYSQRQWGTIVLSRIYLHPPGVPKSPMEIRTLILPKPGEEACGDGVSIVENKEHVKIFLGDGLGHGPNAEAAVQAAIGNFERDTTNDPVAILREIHPEVKKTRGLVGSVLIYNFKENNWRACGVGNVVTRTQQMGSYKVHLSYNGTLGVVIPHTLNEQKVPNERGQVMAMQSDGIKTRWDMLRYPGILKHDLTILCAAIYKDFGRRTDDMSIVLARLNS